MRFTAAILLAASRTVVSHYVFSRISHNDGLLLPSWQHVRDVEEGWAYTPTGSTSKANPAYDVYDANIRCGRGASKKGAGVETLAVNGGDRLAFFSERIIETDPNNQWIYHGGAGQAYMSLSTGALEHYEGDGDWFKIGSIVAKDESNYALLTAPSMNFTIPAATPAGKYLLRVEHIFGYSSGFNKTQFYVNCAHIEVKSDGRGKPGPVVKFPGAYDLWDTALWMPFSATEGQHLNLTDYAPPGPPVWTGED